MDARNKVEAAAAKVAKFTLTTGATAALGIFLGFAYLYGWSGQRQFVSRLYIVIYYLVPLALSAMFFGLLLLPPLLKVRVAIVSITVAASVYATELLLASPYFSTSVTKPVMTRLAESRNKGRDAAELTKRWGVDIDARTAHEVIADLQTSGVDAVPIITPANHLLIEQPDGSLKSAIAIDGKEVLPLTAVSDRVTVLCNEIGQWIYYLSDEHGFNNANEQWRSDRVEIAALGDSYTHGYCVPADRNFVALIRRRYPATLNLGIAGNGPLLMLATLRDYVSALKPKIVLWFYYEGNDLTDLQRERRSALLRSYLAEGFTQRAALARRGDIDRAILEEIPRLRALEESNRLRREGNVFTSRLMAFVTMSELRERLGLVGGIDAKEQDVKADLESANMETFREVLRQAKARVDEWGGQFYFVYLPEWARYTPNMSWGKSQRDVVLTATRNLGIQIIDLDSAFRASGDPLSLFPFRAVGHYNELGHRVVADAVLTAMTPPR